MATGRSLLISSVRCECISVAALAIAVSPLESVAPPLRVDISAIKATSADDFSQSKGKSRGISQCHLQDLSQKRYVY